MKTTTIYLHETKLFDLVLLVLCIKSCHHSPCFPFARGSLSIVLQSLRFPRSFSLSYLYYFHLPLLTIRPLKAVEDPRHSAPRSWQERDFCLMNLPTSRSRGYRGTRLDRKRLAREVMLSRWPPPIMSSALVPGGQGDSPLASRTAHSRSSGVR